MSISNAEVIRLYGLLGIGKIPSLGGPASLQTPSIAQTHPLETLTGTQTPLSTRMYLSSIYINTNQTIRNINYISSGAESGGSHLWFALYDDGRGSSSAGQLALLGQTADQTGAVAFPSTTNLGLSLLTPYTTTYSGVYYVGFQCVAGGTPTILAVLINGGATSAGAFYGGFVSVNSSNAPNPSGAINTSSANTFNLYAYVS